MRRNREVDVRERRPQRLIRSGDTAGHGEIDHVDIACSSTTGSNSQTIRNKIRFPHITHNNCIAEQPRSGYLGSTHHAYYQALISVLLFLPTFFLCFSEFQSPPLGYPSVTLVNDQSHIRFGSAVVHHNVASSSYPRRVSNVSAPLHPSHYPFQFFTTLSTKDTSKWRDSIRLYRTPDVSEKCRS